MFDNPKERNLREMKIGSFMQRDSHERGYDDSLVVGGRFPLAISFHISTQQGNIPHLLLQCNHHHASTEEFNMTANKLLMTQIKMCSVLCKSFSLTCSVKLTRPTRLSLLTFFTNQNDFRWIINVCWKVQRKRERTETKLTMSRLVTLQFQNSLEWNHSAILWISN